MQLTKEQKHLISDIISELIILENVEQTNILAMGKALNDARKAVINYVLEDES